MAVISTAVTTWSGSLLDGGGSVDLASSGSSLAVDWRARSEGGTARTTPEELIAAAHSSCYSMALSHALGEAGTPPTTLRTEAVVTFVPGTGITGSHLTVVGRVPGLSAADFDRVAQEAKTGCPVSVALASIPITLDARLDTE